MKKYRTIKELVLDINNRIGLSDYEAITREVKKYFPGSKWNESHFAWYRSQIRTGKMTSTQQLPSKVLRSDPDVKRIGDQILNHINFIFLDISAKNDSDLRFKINRWVYSRLLQAEVRAKRPIKKQLWNGGMRSCQAAGCPKKFSTLKNVEIHRKDSTKAYSVENCILVCRECHEKSNT